VRDLGSVGAQQLRVTRKIVSPMPCPTSLALDAQGPPHAGEQPTVLG
jgi:hypothetical protein